MPRRVSSKQRLIGLLLLCAAASGQRRPMAPESCSGRRDELYGLPQYPRHFQPGHAPPERLGNLHPMPRRETRTVCLRALRRESRRLHGVSHPARQRQCDVTGPARDPVLVPAMPCGSIRGQCAARAAEFPDARRLYPLPCRDSRVEFRRQLPALRTRDEDQNHNRIRVTYRQPPGAG